MRSGSFVLSGLAYSADESAVTIWPVVAILGFGQGVGPEGSALTGLDNVVDDLLGSTSIIEVVNDLRSLVAEELKVFESSGTSRHGLIVAHHAVVVSHSPQSPTLLARGARSNRRNSCGARTEVRAPQPKC